MPATTPFHSRSHAGTGRRSCPCQPLCPTRLPPDRPCPACRRGMLACWAAPCPVRPSLPGPASIVPLPSCVVRRVPSLDIHPPCAAPRAQQPMRSPVGSLLMSHVSCHVRQCAWAAGAPICRLGSRPRPSAATHPAVPGAASWTVAVTPVRAQAPPQARFRWPAPRDLSRFPERSLLGPQPHGPPM